jgi:protein O-mannosyl-transferase
MAKKRNPDSAQQNTQPKEKRQRNSAEGKSNSAFSGMAWVYAVILLLVTAVLYLPTSSYPYTELDDTIFIREFESYNRQSSNYTHSFKRGVFSDSVDTYYRPLLLNSFVYDRQREGKTNSYLHSETETKDSISAYHTTNIVLHVLSVAMLFFLLRMIGSVFWNESPKYRDQLSFVLALIFAVHPVLTQAVAWIPGRNDSLLAVFVLGYALSALSSVRTANSMARIGFIIMQGILLLLALFTKETGVISALVVGLLLILTAPDGITSQFKKPLFWINTTVWILAIVVWYLFRKNATVLNQDLTPQVIISGFIERLPLITQYLGKIIIPANLTVFPQQDDTSNIYGIIALTLLAIGIAVAPKKDWRVIAFGIIWYGAFLLPALIVPKSLNTESFEHRVYLPFIGILILLTQTWIVQKASTLSWSKYLLPVGVGVAIVLGIVTMNRMSVFSDRFMFWEEAERNAPNSAYAKMMLGSRYYLDKVNPRKQEGERLIRESYSLDSTRKYINYYMGNLAFDRNEFLSAEPYYLREVQNIPNWSELYFRLARIEFEKKNLPKAQTYLEKQIALSPLDAQGNNNLLMVYLDTKQIDKARSQAKRMISNNLDVAQPIRQQLGL